MAAITNSVSHLDFERLVRKYKRGMVNSLLEFFILDYAANGSLCGYDIITRLHERFHVLLSPGQVYPVIDQMATHGLLTKTREGRAVLLRPSFLGASLLKAWRQEFRAIQLQIESSVSSELRAVA
jgi:DNA-binding PadR family transcriptional regulator